MTNSVTFPAGLGGDGKTYTDDADPDTGLDGLGYTVRFIPCLEQAVIMGLSAKDSAEAAASFAAQCQTLRNAVSADRQAVASDRNHVNQQRNAVDAAAQEAAQSAASVNANNIVHAPGSGLQNAAGTAASRDVTTSATDTTAGRLMKVGDFGLGGIGTLNNEFLPDIDAELVSGLFSYDPNTLGPLPEGSAGALLSMRRASRRFQISVHESRIRPRVEVRVFNGAWGDWQALVSFRDILGTVSQSGGFPTGAIIERGSNANGEYTKFADGTLHCWKSAFRVTGSGNSIEDGWNFPHSFADSDYVAHASRSNNSTHLSTGLVRNHINHVFSNTSKAPQRVNVGVRFTVAQPADTWVDLFLSAIGRWY